MQAGGTTCRAHVPWHAACSPRPRPNPTPRTLDMPRKHGPWTIEDTVEKYRNSFIAVQEDRVIQPDGQPGRYSTVTIKPGVAVLPVDEDGDVYLVRQFRYALGRESVEVA